MNIDKLLNNPLINRSELARLMYPQYKDKNAASRYLYKKINNKERQTLNFTDREKIKKIIKQLIDDVYNN